MRIAIIGSTRFDTIEFHIKDELIFQGNEVEIFDLNFSFLSDRFNHALNLFSTEYVRLINLKVLNKILSYKPDLVIGIYRNIDPILVRGVKKNGIKIIHVNPDALTTFGRQQIFTEPYDAYFTKDLFILDFMKSKMGLNCYHYNEAFNPRFHFQKNVDFISLENEIKIDVLTFGNLYPYRNKMLSHLIDQNIDLKIFGRKAKYFPSSLMSAFQNKGIYGEEKSKYLNGSKIVFNNFHYAEIESVNNKFFEINGAGAFQICDYKPILNDILPIDPKLVSFKNIDDAIKKIKYFLNEPEHRYEIRKIIKKHFMENYTYKNLIDRILNV